jgi:formamidopyrimidine-DNA glycosylase
MLELPEFVNFAKQINKTLSGKTIRKGTLGNSPHKFVWYNRSHEEFEELIEGKIVGHSYAEGKWLFVELNPGYVLLLGECGGKILYHPPQSRIPKKYHLLVVFDDDSFLSATTQMWGAIELYKKGEERNRQYVKDMNATPVESEFTFGYFNDLIDSLSETGKKTVKGLLTQDQTILGIGNAIAQDILFKAGLHPKQPIDDLSQKQRKELYIAIKSTIDEIITCGGRNDEYDLYNSLGKYIRLMDKRSVGKPCTRCGTRIETIQYLGGACYYCPSCQRIE